MMKKLALGMMTGMMTGFLLLVSASLVEAGPIVTYTVSGTPGNYLLNCSVTNALSVCGWQPIGAGNVNGYAPSPDLLVNVWHNNSHPPGRCPHDVNRVGGKSLNLTDNLRRKL